VGTLQIRTPDVGQLAEAVVMVRPALKLATRLSSALRMAIPPGAGNPQFPLGQRDPSMDRRIRCARSPVGHHGDIGFAILQSFADLARVVIPISSTRPGSNPAGRRIESGNPISLLKLPIVLPVGIAVERKCASHLWSSSYPRSL